MAKKAKVKAGPKLLVHMTREWAAGAHDDLLLLDPSDERVESLTTSWGFVLAGVYQLNRTGGGLLDMTLPKSGIFADAYSPMAKSPWSKFNVRPEE